MEAVPRGSRDTARAVSQENVRALREMYGRRTFADAASLLHPEAEMHQPSALPDSDQYYGREEFMRGTRRWLEEWEEFSFVPEEVTDLGDRAFMRVRISGRARASGIKLEQTAFHLWTFRDGLPWRCQVFVDEDRALKAAGLDE
jgi:ketosteroid isomerase-like protein